MSRSRNSDIKISLSTNVPLEKTADKVTDVFTQVFLKTFTLLKITKNVFRNLLKTCPQNVLIFNG